MVGTDRDAPRLLVVPQPRDRDLRFAFAADLAEVVLPYVDGVRADHRDGRSAKTGEPSSGVRDAPQLLVPNRGGVGVRRLLGRSTRFRRTDGPYPVAPSRAAARAGG